MPLRRQLPPFLFDGLVGRVFGPLFTPNGLQVIFCRQTRFDVRRYAGILPLPKAPARKYLAPANQDGRSDTDSLSLARYRAMFRFAQLRRFFLGCYNTLSSRFSCGLSCRTAFSSEL
jgi:hypothetical protein